jgi:hypothetical protein
MVEAIRFDSSHYTTVMIGKEEIHITDVTSTVAVMVSVYTSDDGVAAPACWMCDRLQMGSI